MIEGEGGTDDGEEDEAEIADAAIDGHHDIGDAVGMAGGGAQLLVDVLEVTDSLLFMAEYLDDFLPCHHLLDIAVDTGEVLLLGAEERAGALAQLAGGYHHDDSHEDADEGQGDAQHDHRGEGGDDGDGGGEHLCQGGGDHLAQGVDIIGVDGHDIAMGTLVEITDGQPLHPLEDLLAQSEHGALADGYHEAVVGIGADGADEQDEP